MYAEKGISSIEVEKQGLAWFMASRPYLLYVRDPERDNSDTELSTPRFQSLNLAGLCTLETFFTRGHRRCQTRTGW